MKSFVGETWYSFGFALTSSAKVPDRGGFAPDLYFISGESTRSKVFIASLSYGYVQPLGKQDGQAFQPYAAARAGLSYFDYGVQVTVADRRSAKALGVTGNVELGVLVGDRLAISARYDFLGKRDRLDFDGLSLQLSYGIIRF
ncbi:MAG: hypothetical protein MUC92_06090 [Fimbriimonadaceae bacterium]|nr:hypothetical protein [Fimbriimonadaceae bacterium]